MDWILLFWLYAKIFGNDMNIFCDDNHSAHVLMLLEIGKAIGCVLRGANALPVPVFGNTS